MVVCHLRGVEHALRFLQGFATDGSDELCVWGDAAELRLVEPVHRLSALGIDVV